MVIKECVKVLERCTPCEYQYDGWMARCQQWSVLTLYLDSLTVSVSIKELERAKTDDEVKKLIKGRIINVLQDAITRLDSDTLEGTEHDRTIKRQSDN